MKRLGIMIVALAACSKNAGDSHPTQERCQQATAKLSALYNLPASPELEKTKDKDVARCVAEWTNARVDCVLAAKDVGAARACTPSRSKGPDGEARQQVQQVAFEAYPSWQVKAPDRACPTLAELAPFITGNKTADPWGHELHIYCGADAPPGVHGLGVASPGPDGKLGTDDDIKSW